MFLWFVVLLSEARGAKDIAEAVGMPGVSVFLAFLPVDRIHKIPKIIIRTICGLSVMLAVLYLLLAQLPSRRIFPHSRGEAIRYLEQEFPGETLTISREPIRYVDRGCMQTAWMAESERVPGLSFYVISERYFYYDGWAGEFGHYYYRLTTSYESSFRNYLIEMGDFQFLKGVSDYYREGAPECVFVVFENVEQIDQMEEWRREKEQLVEQLEECGQPTDFSVAYGCRSVNSAFIGDYVSFRGVNERLEPDELRALLKERYQEYQIAFCATELMDPDTVREAVEKSRHRFYSFRGSDGQRRSHDTLLLVPYIAGVGLMDKGSISLETMYYLLKEYEIRVDGGPDHFTFQGINEKQNNNIHMYWSICIFVTY